MPITFEVNHARRRLYCQMSGVCHYGDIVAFMDAVEDIRKLDYSELVNCTSFVPQFTAEEVRLIVERIRRTWQAHPFGPTGIVAPDDLAYGMARMYGTLCDTNGPCVRAFRDLADAERWLDETTCEKVVRSA